MLLGSVRASRKKRSRMPQFVIAGVVLLTLTFLIAAVSFIVGSVTAVSATVHQYREVNAQLPNAADVASNAFQTTRSTTATASCSSRSTRKTAAGATSCPSRMSRHT